MMKPYGLLWLQCTLGMRAKIEGRTDYESTVKNNPIELLKAIKEHALNCQEHCYEMTIINEAEAR
jgi:hypothetical protein